jgi:hypothetical protein
MKKELPLRSPLAAGLPGAYRRLACRVSGSQTAPLRAAAPERVSGVAGRIDPAGAGKAS